jgi:Methyltransferase domain
LNSPFIGSAYSEFHPWGIGGGANNYTANGIPFDTKPIMTIVNDLGHVGRRLDILKIDCEGCEGTAMVPLFEAIIRQELQVDQIMIELHS